MTEKNTNHDNDGWNDNYDKNDQQAHKNYDFWIKIG